MEAPDDYQPFVYDCPAEVAISQAQHEWAQLNKGKLDSFQEGKGPNPSQGIYWLSKHRKEVW